MIKIPLYSYFMSQSNLNGHKNMIGYVDSSIVSQGNGVYEVLMLMPYCRNHVLSMMNSRYLYVVIFNPTFSCFNYYNRFLIGNLSDSKMRNFLLFMWAFCISLVQWYIVTLPFNLVIFSWLMRNMYNLYISIFYCDTSFINLDCNLDSAKRKSCIFSVIFVKLCRDYIIVKLLLFIGI